MFDSVYFRLKDYRACTWWHRNLEFGPQMSHPTPVLTDEVCSLDLLDCQFETAHQTAFLGVISSVSFVNSPHSCKIWWKPTNSPDLQTVFRSNLIRRFSRLELRLWWLPKQVVAFGEAGFCLGLFRFLGTTVRIPIRLWVWL